MSDTHISPRGTAWSALRKEVFTSEEIAESDVRVKSISKRIEARDVVPLDCKHKFHRARG